jgi:hypothetical protein
MLRRPGTNESSRRLRLTAAFAGIVACGGTDVTARWATDAIRVDGDGVEWSGPELAYVEDVSGVVGAANNDSSVYVMLRFADPRMGRKVMLGGATVWWNKDGKKEKDVGVRYGPVIDLSHILEQGGDLREALSRTGGPGSAPQEGTLHDLVTLLDEDGETLLLEGEQRGISAGSAYEDGIYCYEIEIPLHRGEDDSRSVDVPLGDGIRLCVELGGLSSEAREMLQQMMGERRGRMGGGPGGGMGPGGRPPGGMGGGRRGGRAGMGRPGAMGRGGGPTDMLEEKELWCTIRLAERPEKTAGTA